jgi:hypothetical protein
VLHHQQRGAAPLTPDGDALQGAQYDEQYRGKDSDGLEGWQNAYQEGGNAHEEEGEDEYGLPAQLVAVVPEDGSS